MSYLSDLKNRRTGAVQFLGLSARYILSLGKTLIPSDSDLDAAQKRAEEGAATAAAASEAAFAVYLRTHYPMLPAEVIASQAATAALTLIDSAISGATNVLKANNVDPVAAPA